VIPVEVVYDYEDPEKNYDDGEEEK